jgi:phosphate transport system substrate-binding protein
MRKVSVIKKIIIIAFHKSFFTGRETVNNLVAYSSNLKLRYIILGLVIFILSCNNGGNAGFKNTPTSGEIRIAVDDSFQPLIDTEVFTFTHLYPNASITPLYKPEFDVINDFMNDTVQVMVTSKKLSESQIKYLRDTLVIARTTTFAHDALALITNRENRDTLMRYETVNDIFLKKVTRWKQINPKSDLDIINVIFDNNKSGNIRYFKELFNIDSLGSNFFAVNSNVEVIDYVSRNKNALGIISVNWISDKDDSLSMSFIRKVNVLAVSRPFLNDGTYYRPQPGSIYEKSYPFVRDIYLISRETYSGLGSGFISWACGEQGQRIVLKSGLVPATMPIRLVQMKE